MIGPAPVAARLVPMRAFDVWSGLAFVLGVCLPSWLPRLWPGSVLMAIGVGSVLLLMAYWRLARLAFFGLGLVWASIVGGQALTVRIAPSLVKQELAVSGRVLGLPRVDLLPVRFEMQPDAASAARLGSRGRLRLSWYQTAPRLLPGQRFVGSVRLRLPQGVQNPGGFDFERYAFEQRFAATGYVRSGRVFESGQLTFLAQVDRLRLKLSQRIADQVADATLVALLQALAVGDQRGLQGPEWAILRNTGTGHLIAISGMHVGLVAGFGALCFGLWYRLFPRLALRLPRLLLAAVGALLAAAAYALLAGWSLPVQRTLVMIAVVLLARLQQRNASMPQSLAVAAVVVLLIDPLAVLNASFWLSFLGVAGLLWCLPGKATELVVAPSLRQRAQTLLSGFGRAQLAMSIGLLPVVIAFFGQSSLVGPLANLLAVPWITFVVIPLLLIALLLGSASVALGSGLLQLAAGLLHPLWSVLASMADWPGAAIHFPEPDGVAVVLATIGALWLFMPRGVPARAVALPLFLPLLWPLLTPIDEGDARISMIDVGQGLSVLVQTRRHTLLFDAGAGSARGFDFGEAVVVPSLVALGVRQLDRLVLSNLDNDHAGGRGAVLAAWPDAAVQIGIDADPAPRCLAGERWQWDGVAFEFLHPPIYFPDIGNDSSCVLRVQSNRGAALLTGDISALIEARLLRDQAPLLRADLVFVPHHGSRSASSLAFVQATGARLAWISAGRDNRYGHPDAEVVARWQAAGARVVNSADSGFVAVSLGDLNAVGQRRLQHPHYWQ